MSRYLFLMPEDWFRHDDRVELFPSRIFKGHVLKRADSYNALLFSCRAEHDFIGYAPGKSRCAVSLRVNRVICLICCERGSYFRFGVGRVPVDVRLKPQDQAGVNMWNSVTFLNPVERLAGGVNILRPVIFFVGYA